jgi:hypothetical protein
MTVDNKACLSTFHVSFISHSAIKAQKRHNYRIVPMSHNLVPAVALSIGNGAQLPQTRNPECENHKVPIEREEEDRLHTCPSFRSFVSGIGMANGDGLA